MLRKLKKNEEIKPSDIVLDLGCGIGKVPGTIGVDTDPNSDAEIIHDFNVFPYPFENNYADAIYAKHIIEHLDHPDIFLKEIYRILKPGAIAYIETPHFSNYIAYSEPQHKLFYSYFMFRSLLARADVKFKSIKWELTFYKTFRMFGIRYLANKYPESYERFWTYMFPAENIKIELLKEE
jgi:SAM-dependent methyltransferase